MELLTQEQLHDLAYRINTALEQRVIHMVDDPRSVDCQMAVASYSVIATRAFALSLLGKEISPIDLMTLMFCLGKVAEREGWILEYLPEE